MGYDMCFVTVPDGDATSGYFRLTVRGMARYRAAMVALGMTYDSTARDGRPEAPGERVEALTPLLDQHRSFWPPAVTDEELAAARAHRERIKVHLKRHPAGGDTIPVHKLDSNDGWRVSAAEITAALREYDAHPEPAAALARVGIDTDGRRYWDDWIGWLRRAAEHDGFEVH